MVVNDHFFNRLAMKKNQNSSVAWYLPKKKKPFTYSTVAESAGIKLLLDIYGDLRKIPIETLLNENEWLIINTLIENGVYQPKLY